MRTRLMLPMRGSLNPGFWKPRTPSPLATLPVMGDGGTSVRRFLSDDLRGDKAIGLDDTEDPEMMELLVA